MTLNKYRPYTVEERRYDTKLREALKIGDRNEEIGDRNEEIGTRKRCAKRCGDSFLQCQRDPLVRDKTVM